MVFNFADCQYTGKTLNYNYIIMFKKLTTVSVLTALFSYSLVYAQSVGINTDKPGSTLDINGSLAAKYSTVNAATYAMTSGDFHISYNGSGNTTFTLPAAVSGEGNFKGRMYNIKNNTAFIITINAAASETINGNASVTVAPNQSLQLISTGLTGAASTWDVSGNSSAAITASNGLSLVGNDVRLGGTLTQNTAIDYADKALYLRSNNTGFGLTGISNINAGTNAATILQLTNDSGNALNMFLNSSTRSLDGGANAATINNSGGPLTVAGNNNVAQFAIGTSGLQYNYATLDRLRVDSNGDIYMNRPEEPGGGGNKISASKGHLDLSGYNTLNGSSTQVYLGAEGFKYSYNASTKVIIDGNGTVSAAGGFVNTSDMRLKTQIKEITYGLNTIMALQPKQYELSDHIEIKDGKPVVNPALSTQHKIGFLAQDLYQKIPEAVYKPKDETKQAWGVDYALIVPALTKAIQEQQAEIEKQKAIINKLETELQFIKKKLGL